MHELTMCLAGAEQDDGPLHHLVTAEPMPVPNLGEPVNLSAWPAPRFPLGLAAGEVLNLVDIERDIVERP
jgi:hypothetical protein